MLGRVLDRVIDAQVRWAKPFGDWLHGLMASIFGRMLPIRDFLAGTWLGHPLHALLTDVPIGALTLVIVLDVLGQPVAADVALLVGVLTMVAAAVAGFADYSTTDGRARVRATVHSSLMIASLVVYVVSLAIRATGPTSRAVPIVLSIIGYLILAGGAFVGGDVVYLPGQHGRSPRLAPVGREVAAARGRRDRRGQPGQGQGRCPGPRPDPIGRHDPGPPRPVRPRRRTAQRGHDRGRLHRVPLARLAVRDRDRPAAARPDGLRPAGLRGPAAAAGGYEVRRIS